MSEEDTLPIFTAEALVNLIEYKWDTYGYKGHYVGCAFHICYIAFLSVYIALTYLQENGRGGVQYGVDGEEKVVYITLIVIGFSFPFVYELVQMAKTGTRYFKDSWNYTDISFSIVGLVNIMFQYSRPPTSIQCTATLVVVLILALFKTFFFLRIFGPLAPLVSLMKTVIVDLVPFVVFYALLLFKFDLILGVVGYENLFFGYDLQDVTDAVKEDNPNEYPGFEYQAIGHPVGNFITVFRMSMGDNDLGPIIYLGPDRGRLFWFVWALICYLTFIIFFNFVIAEASVSYNVVHENLENILMHGKAELVDESEDMLPASSRTPEKFPKYLIVRDSSN